MPPYVGPGRFPGPGKRFQEEGLTWTSQSPDPRAVLRCWPQALVPVLLGVRPACQRGLLSVVSGLGLVDLVPAAVSDAGLEDSHRQSEKTVASRELAVEVLESQRLILPWVPQSVF